jgi:hypothetical protein
MLATSPSQAHVGHGYDVTVVGFVGLQCHAHRNSCSDTAAAQVLADWYALGAQALAQLAAEVAHEMPTEAQLWPEHFDLGITVAR